MHSLLETTPRIDLVVSWTIAGSGLGSHPKLDALRSLGVEHFITKPYTAETLLKKLREVLAEESVRTP